MRTTPKQNRPKLILSIVSFASLLNVFAACPPKPPDVAVFESLTQWSGIDKVTGHLVLKASPACMKQIGEAECGHGTYIVSGREVYIGENPKYWFNKKPWSQIKKESILVPAIESYAPISTYIINACNQMHCEDDVDRFKVKIDSLNGINNLIKGNK